MTLEEENKRMKAALEKLRYAAEPMKSQKGWPRYVYNIASEALGLPKASV